MDNDRVFGGRLNHDFLELFGLTHVSGGNYRDRVIRKLGQNGMNQLFAAGPGSSGHNINGDRCHMILTWPNQSQNMVTKGQTLFYVASFA